MRLPRLRGRLSRRHLAMLVLLGLLAVVHLVGERRLPVLDQVAGVLWVLLAALVVLSLRSVELAAGKAASQTRSVTEVRDVTRRIAGSVGTMSKALASGQRPAAPAAAAPGPRRSSGAAVETAPPRPARPTLPPTPPPTDGELTGDESAIRRLVGRATALPLESQRRWEPVAETVAARCPPRAGVAVVGSPDLLRRLSAVVPVVPLQPGYALRLLELTNPRTVVVDREAFVAGAWFGAETTSGLDLVEEVEDVAAWARDHHVEVLWLEAPRADGPGTRALRALSRTHLPLAEDELRPGGAPQTPVFRELQRVAAARSARVRVTA